MPSLPALSRPVRRTRSGDRSVECPSRPCPRQGAAELDMRQSPLGAPIGLSCDKAASACMVVFPAVLCGTARGASEIGDPSRVDSQAGDPGRQSCSRSQAGQREHPLCGRSLVCRCLSRSGSRLAICRCAHAWLVRCVNEGGFAIEVMQDSGPKPWRIDGPIRLRTFSVTRLEGFPPGTFRARDSRRRRGWSRRWWRRRGPNRGRPLSRPPLQA